MDGLALAVGILMGILVGTILTIVWYEWFVVPFYAHELDAARIQITDQHKQLHAAFELVGRASERVNSLNEERLQRLPTSSVTH